MCYAEVEEVEILFFNYYNWKSFDLMSSDGKKLRIWVLLNSFGEKVVFASVRNQIVRFLEISSKSNHLNFGD